MIIKQKLRTDLHNYFTSDLKGLTVLQQAGIYSFLSTHCISSLLDYNKIRIKKIDSLFLISGSSRLLQHKPLEFPISMEQTAPLTPPHQSKTRPPGLNYPMPGCCWVSARPQPVWAPPFPCRLICECRLLAVALSLYCVWYLWNVGPSRPVSSSNQTHFLLPAVPLL